MTTVNIRRPALAPVSGLVRVAALVRAWNRRRRDRRVIDGLSDDQLKDIGYRRLPDGDLEPRAW